MAETILRRYTDLPAALSILHNQELTLLDPASWDDGNDRHFMQQYKQRRERSTVLALCFSRAPETYHHWRVFSAGGAGICINFKRALLVQAVAGHPNIRQKNVSYVQIKNLGPRRLKVSELPFTKRWPFRNEEEYRIIYESSTETLPAWSFPLPISAIERVVVSPWLHLALYPRVKATLKAIPGCGALKVVRSTLVGNDIWKSYGDGAA